MYSYEWKFFLNKMEQKEKKEIVLQGVCQIVSAYISNNTVRVSDMDSLIRNVYDSLMSMGKSSGPKVPSVGIDIEKSITPDYIVCLEDGKRLKMLKRHLRTAYGMTPQQYRDRWSLPHDYPMVAPNYAKKRSFLARNYGLGHGSSSSAVG